MRSLPDCKGVNRQKGLHIQRHRGKLHTIIIKLRLTQLRTYSPSRQFGGLEKTTVNNMATDPMCFWIYLLILFVSFGFCSKLPQTWWLKTTHMYYVTVLEIRSLKTKVSSSCIPSRDSREVPPSLPFPLFRGCIHSLAQELPSPSELPVEHLQNSLSDSGPPAIFL